jgi:methylase of polypeptide subunit release factors
LELRRRNPSESSSHAIRIIAAHVAEKTLTRGTGHKARAANAKATQRIIAISKEERSKNLPKNALDAEKGVRIQRTNHRVKTLQPSPATKNLPQTLNNNYSSLLWK